MKHYLKSDFFCWNELTITFPVPNRRGLLVMVLCMLIALMSFDMADHPANFKDKAKPEKAEKFEIIPVSEFIAINDEPVLNVPTRRGDEPPRTEFVKPVIAKPERKIEAPTTSMKTVAGQPMEDAISYITRFARIAQVEQDKFGIPASVTLAQGLLESACGNSELASPNLNNHFGIKCFARNCKKGHCVNRYDDSHKDFFRVFDSAWASYRAHSLHLTAKKGPGRGAYGWMVDKYPVGSPGYYKNWACGLKRCGYATDPGYAQKLIGIIDGLGLTKYDRH